MARYDFRSPRLYVDAPIAQGSPLPLDRAQTNYLCNVLRLVHGDPVLVFNGRDGEWRADLDRGGKRSASLIVRECARPQTPCGDLHYLFAPLKHARLDYMVQKAVELGASRLQPVMTRHTQTARINQDRMRANVIEAAEQCGILSLPETAEARPLDRALGELEPDRMLVFCDEEADVADPFEALASLRGRHAFAVLIGPEGGFAETERALLLRRECAVRLSLGPRILRADTAAVAALTLIQAVAGDWR